MHRLLKSLGPVFISEFDVNRDSLTEDPRPIRNNALTKVYERAIWERLKRRGQPFPS